MTGISIRHADQLLCTEFHEPCQSAVRFFEYVSATVNICATRPDSKPPKKPEPDFTILSEGEARLPGTDGL